MYVFINHRDCSDLSCPCNDHTQDILEWIVLTVLRTSRCLPTVFLGSFYLPIYQAHYWAESAWTVWQRLITHLCFQDFAGIELCISLEASHSFWQLCSVTRTPGSEYHCICFQTLEILSCQLLPSFIDGSCRLRDMREVCTLSKNMGAIVVSSLLQSQLPLILKWNREHDIVKNLPIIPVYREWVGVQGRKSKNTKVLAKGNPPSG